MIEYLYQTVLPSIENFQSLIYGLAFLVAFSETTLVVGLLIPGSSLLLILGAFSATGKVDFTGILLFGIAGAVLGDNLNYWLGKRYGQQWLKNGVLFLKPEHFQRAHNFFELNGAKSVFLGRFIPSIKEVVPFIAGSADMHRGTFMLWNMGGGIGWGLQWIGGGYLFGQSLAIAQAWMSRIGLVFLTILLLWFVLWYLKHILIRQGPQIWELLKSLYFSIASALTNNAHVRQFKHRYPHVINFIKNRINHTHFSGLPLTLLSLSLLYVAILFGGIIEDFLTSNSIITIDHTVAQLIEKFRPPEVIPTFIWITALGIPAVAVPLIILATIGSWVYRGRWLALSLMVSVVGTSIFTLLSKELFHRSRPVDAILLEHSYSFPSGHAAIAVGFYGFLGYLLIRTAPSLRSRINYILMTFLVIFAIGLSRIVLDVHYLSDVWAGYLVGSGWLLIAISISEWASARGQLNWHTPLTPKQRTILIALFILAIGWYSIYTSQWHPKTRTPPVIAQEPLTQQLPTVIKEKGLLYTETLFGTPVQSLSVAFITADKALLIQNIKSAGWQKADPPTLHNLLKLLQHGMDYINAPLVPTFWNGRINNLAFERLDIINGKRVINTLRLWKTHWLKDGALVYVGVMRSYTGIYWGVLHKISPDSDTAAQQLKHSLSTQIPELVSCEIHLSEPKVGNYLLGMPFFSSGKLIIMDLDNKSGKPLALCKEKNRS